MTPFQSINATIYMLIAKAREPIQDPGLVPAVSRATRQRSGPERSVPADPPATQMRRRRSDSPFQHESLVHRTWKAVAAWVSGG